MFKVLFNCCVVLLIIAFLPVIYFKNIYTNKSFAQDFGVFEIRKKYEYIHIYKHPNSTPALKLSLNEQLPDGEQLERYVLPLDEEEVDDRLFEILEAMEGDSSQKTYFKGLVKGAITTSGFSIKSYGGGSNLIITTAGNLLENYSDKNKSNKIRFRLNEIKLANYILSFSSVKQKQIILGQACLVGNARGCTTASVLMFNKLKPTTDRERLILASSIRFPITESNKERLVKYANQKCHSLKNNKLLDVGECNISDNDFSPKIDVGKVRLTGEIVPFCKGKVEYFPQRHSLAEKVKKVVNNMNADVEMSIMKYANRGNGIFEDGVLLARCSNNQVIAKNGFNSLQNTASTAKLFLALSNNELPKEFVKAMQDSDNSEIERIARDGNISPMDIETKFHQIGINPSYANHPNDFIHAMSYGNISMSSDDMHKFLFVLPSYSRSPNKKQGVKSAMNGTLSHLKSNMRAIKIKTSQIVVAKSGTHSVRQPDTPKLKEGVHGSLAVFTIEKDRDIYTIVVRMHSKDLGTQPSKLDVKQDPICLDDNCTKLSLQELVDASFYIIQNQPKKSN